jgi:acyl-CoA thioesterase
VLDTAQQAEVSFSERGLGFGDSLHGGYVSAAVLGAILDLQGDPSAGPLSLTIHYLSPAHPGQAIVRVTPERVGRSLSTLSFRLAQSDSAVAVGLVVLSQPRLSDVQYCEYPMPVVAPPEQCSRAPRSELGLAPWADEFDMRPCIGDGPYSGSSQALTGGWIKPVDARPLDLALLAGLTDCWVPSVRTRLSASRGPEPTVDMTVHFRSHRLEHTSAPADFCLVRFESRMAEGGFWEEDGLVWSRAGTLLAQSRQLAVIR